MAIGPIKLVARPTVDDEIRNASIAILREALADVEVGKVSSIIVLSKETDGTWMHRATATISIREEIGSLEMLSGTVLRAREMPLRIRDASTFELADPRDAENRSVRRCSGLFCRRRRIGGS
jgi:hypothetical protein